MSRQKNEPNVLDRNVVRSFMGLHWKNQIEFCKEYNINVGSFRVWMMGVETMPKITEKVEQAMSDYNYPIQHAYNPDLELRVVGE